MVNTKQQAISLRNFVKYPPLGSRTYGVNRAQNYGFTLNSYFQYWNESSVFMVQIESREAVENIDLILEVEDIDGVMIGPLDIAGSLGVPGQVTHPLVIQASKKVISACRDRKISCGTQVANPVPDEISRVLDLGYNFIILGSDLFVFQNWAERMSQMLKASFPKN